MTRFGIRLALVFGLFQTSAVLAQDLTQPYVEGQVLVRFQPGLAAADRAAVRGALLPLSSQSIELVPGLELVQTPLSVAQAVAVLTNNPNIFYIEPDYILQPQAMPNDYYLGLEWGLHNTGQDIRNVLGLPDADIDMPEAWDLVPPSAGTVVVAVIDSGTQLDHEDLHANIWVNPDEIAGNGIDDDNNGYVDDINGWDFFSNDNDPSDESGHGTHTAGTIGALTNNGIGIAGVCGDNCKIMPLRFLGPQGGSTSAAILALQYAVAENVKVSNNSWGGGLYSQSLVDAIQQAAGIGHIFVASAGNDAFNTDASPKYPSSYDNWNIISVAATTNQDLLASFSNFGATTVDIGAPGFNVASTYMGNQYYWMSGTSMAAPHVAGVVALLQASEPGLSAQQVINRIYDSARPMAALDGITTTGGMLNAAAALAGTSTEPNPAPPPQPSLPDTPAWLTASNNGDGTAELVWPMDADATHYVVAREERKVKGKNAGSWTGYISYTTSQSPHIDAGGAQEFRYRVSASNSVGTSSPTGWVEVAVTDASGGETDGGGSGKCHPRHGC
ncbi:MAG TPA: S8 family peptidase [Gammaproteobacteria bacterium]|jgi:hypothetical protein